MSFNSLVGTINIALSIIGYQLMAVLFSEQLAVEGHSQVITIPYRAFTLIVAILVIILNWRTHIKYPQHLKVFLALWALVVLRFVLDMMFLPVGTLNSSVETQLVLYMVGITIIPMIATIKSYRVINYKLLFLILYLVSSFICCYLYFTVDEMRIANGDRFSLPGLNSISVGYCGLINILLSLYILVYANTKLLYKLGAAFIIVIGFLIMLRSGSRGPLLSLVFSLVIFVGSRSKNPIRSFIIMIVFVFILYHLISIIGGYIENIAPVLSRRLNSDKGQLVDRMPLYNYALNCFYENPFWGSQFAIYHNGNYSYAHNIFLDCMMQWGIIGLLLITYVYKEALAIIFKFLRYTPLIAWLGFILLRSMTELLVSGSLYVNPDFTIILVLCMLVNRDNTIKRYDNYAKKSSYLAE